LPSIHKNIVKFYLLESAIYMIVSTYGYFAYYFDSVGLSKSQIGILLAIGPIMSLIANPFWLSLTDKKLKNNILTLISGMGIASIWLVYLIPTFLGKAIVLMIMSFFTTAIVPIAESMSIQYLSYEGFSFGRSRMMGSISYSLMILMMGYLISNFGNWIIFLSYSATSALCFLLSIQLPPVQGYNKSKDRKTSHYIDILKRKEYILMLLVAFIGISSGSFGISFYPVYVAQKGFKVSIAGIGMSVMAISEIPFLFYADKIIKRFGNRKILAFGVMMYGIRWLVTSHVSSEMALIGVQLLHATNYIFVYYSIFSYINEYIPEKLKSRAQALFWMVMNGFAIMNGSILGGILSDAKSLSFSYFSFGVLSAVVGTIYMLYNLKEKVN